MGRSGSPGAGPSEGAFPNRRRSPLARSPRGAPVVEPANLSTRHSSAGDTVIPRPNALSNRSRFPILPSIFPGSGMVLEFLHWWLGQLGDLLPERWRSLPSRFADAVLITPDGRLDEAIDSVV